MAPDAGAGARARPRKPASRGGSKSYAAVDQAPSSSPASFVPSTRA
jgi:hypothetical protein